MANPITEKIKKGTVGELLVQLRLLQYNVQAAPPLKDSGNDLIALRGAMVRTIQVKTTTGAVPTWPKRPQYDLLAVVWLQGEENNLRLDESKVFLIPRNRLTTLDHNWEALNTFVLSQEHVSKIFSERCL